MIVIKIFLAVYLFWYMYLATMSLVTQIRRARRGEIKIPWPAKILGYPVAVLFVIVDWIMNRTLFALYFLKFPPSIKELLTERLQIYIRTEPNSYRGKSAKWICVNLLDIFDPLGKHC